MFLRTYLNLDELLDAVHDDEMLVAQRRDSNDNFIACLDPPAVVVVHECLGVGLFVIQVAQNHRGALYEQFAGGLGRGDLVAFEVDDLGLGAGYERSRGSGVTVLLAGGADDGGGLGHAVALAEAQVGEDLEDLVNGFASERGGAAVKNA